MDIVEARKLLGVTPDSTSEEVKKAYYQKIKLTHPDKNGSGDEEIAKDINQAYDICEKAHKNITSRPNSQFNEQPFIPTYNRIMSGNNGIIKNWVNDAIRNIYRYTTLFGNDSEKMKTYAVMCIKASGLRYQLDELTLNGLVDDAIKIVEYSIKNEAQRSK